MRKVLTLAIVVKDGRVLLGEKQRKHGAGLWNGFGGKVETEETIEEAAIRECQEECGITPTKMKKQGEIVFVYPHAPFGATEHEVHIFRVHTYSGNPTATEEMQNPTWFAPHEIPYSSMWPDDEHWMPLLLEGKSFTGTFTFNDNNELVGIELNETF